MRSKGQSQNVFVRIITSPIRALGRARDMYVRSITKCGNNMNYSNPVDAAGRFAAMPRSYSTSTTRSEEGEDFAELMRAASARTLANRIDMDLVMKQQGKTTAQEERLGTKGLPKSSSVGMGKIDEDAPFDGNVNVMPNLYPRSRSYAVGVGKRTTVF
ncbi:Uncharacterized conserved protein UCP031279 [Senna tora]|uniref:Uncharacterized conserved protein UCP031279 n=1 Tax=Senna tora TaxID=362788 RepID=A0A834U1U3_9FABA|nr:Uncharacterized conserved protein UCP031279 [Senna tora]